LNNCVTFDVSPPYFDHVLTTLDFNGWENLTFCAGHVCHGSELVFESGWMNFTDAGRQLATNLVTYWTSFGKTRGGIFTYLLVNSK
jgi:hypothetical protein